MTKIMSVAEHNKYISDKKNNYKSTNRIWSIDEYEVSAPKHKEEIKKVETTVNTPKVPTKQEAQNTLLKANKNLTNQKQILNQYLQNQGVVTNNRNLLSTPSVLTTQEQKQEILPVTKNNISKIKENATQESRQQKGVENVKKYHDFIQTDTGKELKENVLQARDTKSIAQYQYNVLEARDAYENSSWVGNTFRTIKNTALEMLNLDEKNLVRNENGDVYDLGSYGDTYQNTLLQNTTGIGKFYYSVVGELSKQAVSIGLNALTFGGAGTAAYYGDIMENQYNGAIAQGYDKKDAFTYAVGDTVFQSVLDKSMGAGVFKYGDATGLIPSLTNRLSSKFIDSKVVRDIGGSLISEGLTEFIQEYQGKFNENWLLKGINPFTDFGSGELFEDAIFSGLVGMATGGIGKAGEIVMTPQGQLNANQAIDNYVREKGQLSNNNKKLMQDIANNYEYYSKDAKDSKGKVKTPTVEQITQIFKDIKDTKLNAWRNGINKMNSNQNLSDADRQKLNDIERVGESIIFDTNINLHLIAGDPNYNGDLTYNPNTIFGENTSLNVNINSKAPFSGIIDHELAHAFSSKNTENFVLKYMKNRKEENGKSMYDNRKEALLQSGAYDEANIDNELVARQIGELCQSDEFLTELVNYEPQAFDSMKNFIDNISYAFFGNNNDAKYVEMLRNKFKQDYYTQESVSNTLKSSQEILRNGTPEELREYFIKLNKTNYNNPESNHNMTDADIDFLVNNTLEMREAYKDRNDLRDVENTQPKQDNVVKVDLTTPTMEEPKTKTPKTTDQKVAQILTETTNRELSSKEKRHKLWAMARASILDKGSVFEDLSLKNHNRELQAKWDSTLTSQSKAQNIIGNGYQTYDANTQQTTQNSKSLDAIREEVVNTGKTKEFYDYMYHKHNVDRMTLEDRYDNVENKPVFGDEVDAKVSQQKVDEYEKANPEFLDYAQDVYDYLKAQRQSMVDAGLISQETADLWTEMYPHYVPIGRAEQTGLNVNVPLDTNRTTVNSPVKRAKGGNGDILPLFDTMANRTFQTTRAIDRNSFGVELKNTLNSEINRETATMDEITDIGGDNEVLLKEGTKDSLPTFTVFENGEKVTYQISEEMYDALKPVSKGLSMTLSLPNKISNFQRGVLTQYNPVFMFTNMIKDAQDVLINSQHPGKTYSEIPEAYAQIAKKGYWYKEYKANGGEDNTYFDNQNKKFVEESKLKKVLKLPLDKISQLNEYIETVPRLAEYIASRKQGKSIEVAMLDSARVTTNFKAGGDVTKFANRNGATFLNASVQGFNQQIRNFREANANGIKGYMNLLTKFAIAGVPALLLNGLIWDDDEDYEELNDYVKNNYYIIGKLPNGEFIRIPKGRALSVIQNVVDQTMDDSDGIDLGETFKLFIDNLAPNNPLENNVLSPLLNAKDNTTWYGGDIVPQRLQNKDVTQQYDASTSEISKWIGKTFNISPMKVEYVIDQYSGGIGDIVLPMTRQETKNGADSVLDYAISPMKDKFVVDSTFNNKNVTEFYENVDKAKVVASRDKATEEEKVASKYLNSKQSYVNTMYSEKRKIQERTDLSNNEKYELVKEKQEEINKFAKEANTEYKKVKITGNNATVGGYVFKKKTDSDGNVTWERVRKK